MNQQPFTGWNTIVSPNPSPTPFIASSPLPALVRIPEEISSTEAIANTDEGYTQVQRKIPKKYVKEYAKQYDGVGPPPVSVAVGSIYNGRESQKGGIRNFKLFWEDGERGIDGVVVPEEERFRKYTKFVINFHKDFSGKKFTPEHPKIQEYMKEALGTYYPGWAKIFLPA
jgi:hypothetical protein